MKQAVYVAVLWGALFLSVFSAQAESPCNLAPRFEELAALRESALPLDSELRAELDLRKSILREVIGCGVGDAQALQGRLRDARISDSDIVLLRNNLVHKLDDAIRYYESQRSRIDVMGIQGSKNAARALREWRASQYAPLENVAEELFLWNRNQELFMTAEKRFREVEQAVNMFKLIENEDVRVLVGSAAMNVERARGANERAREMLLAFDVPRALQEIKNSLETLSATYESFLTLSEKVRELLTIRER